MKTLTLGFPRSFMPSVFERVFDQVSDWTEWGGGFTSPNVDIIENVDSFIIKAELPGITKEDISIDLKDSTLTISGEKKTEKTDESKTYHKTEISYGKFSRSFQIPLDIAVDKIEAKFKDGILTLTLPKGEEEKPKQIEIN